MSKFGFNSVSMDIDQPLLSMQFYIQDALDELQSPRSTVDAKTRALEGLERQLALACLNDSNSLNHFNSLQYMFECNIPLRLLAWVSLTTPKLDVLTSKGIVEKGRETDVSKMVSQLSLALSITQGIALIHTPSKVYLGRRHALEMLLDLLLVSRHVPSHIPSPHAKDAKDKPSISPHLSSVVLDTLLCILVDSSNSLRSFENVNGVQSVVKILKRAGTPREVRMKCLEFLYFYLMDETPAPSEPAQLPTAPATPIRSSKKPYLSRTPMHPSSRQPSCSSSLFPTPVSSVASLASRHSSRSASNGSSTSMSSLSTAPSSMSSSPENTSVFPENSPIPSTPATSPFSWQNRRSTQMNTPPPVPLLRAKAGVSKETDSAPSSPVKRRHIVPSRSSMSRHGPSKSLSSIPNVKVNPSVPKLEKPGLNKSWSEESCREGPFKGLARLALGSEKIKSTEEKKELLGTMLGNVDALVESVRKAGIWGLS